GGLPSPNTHRSHRAFLPLGLRAALRVTAVRAFVPVASLLQLPLRAIQLTLANHSKLLGDRLRSNSRTIPRATNSRSPSARQQRRERADVALAVASRCTHMRHLLPRTRVDVILRATPHLPAR